MNLMAVFYFIQTFSKKNFYLFFYGWYRVIHWSKSADRNPILVNDELSEVPLDGIQ